MQLQNHEPNSGIARVVDPHSSIVDLLHLSFLSLKSEALETIFDLLLFAYLLYHSSNCW